MATPMATRTFRFKKDFIFVSPDFGRDWNFRIVNANKSGFTA